MESQAESQKQPSALFISDEEIDRVLLGGSGFANGKMRIQALYDTQPNAKERADYLKNEYGLGGRSWTFSDGTRGFVDYSSKGILIRRYGYDQEVRLHWNLVEKKIDALIRNGSYLDEEEKARYAELSERYEAAGGLPLPSPAHAFPELGAEPVQQASEDIDAEEDDFSDIDPAAIREELARRGIVNGELVDPDALDRDPFIRQVMADVERLSADEEAQEPVSGEKPVQMQGELTEEGAGAIEVLEEAEAPEIPAQNFRITDDHLGEGGPKEKYQRNVAAIRLLRTLEEENRNATPEEQSVLSQYVGWGGLADAFDDRKDNWSREYDELKELLTSEEYEMARASTLNAHYTSPTVIRAIY